MYNTKDFKKSAKSQLKGRWCVPVIMTLLCSLVFAVFYIPNAIMNEKGISIKVENLTDKITLTFLIIISFTSVIQLLLKYVTNFAEAHVYLKMQSGNEEIKGKDFFDGLEPWKRSIAAGLLQGLFELLWALLFVIPGVIKHYSYYFTRYIVTEYKGVSVRDAMKISTKATKGHKWQLFITELSFIGWIILGCITLGIGFLWIEPYVEVTFVNAYKQCMKDAMEKGDITAEELR